MKTSSLGSRVLRFVKDWTLAVAIFGGMAVYLIFATIPLLEPAAAVCGHFRQLRLVAWHGWVSLFQLIFVALLVGITLLIRPVGDMLVVAEAVLCCVIAPCAAAAPVVTGKLGGHLEQMTSYVFLSNFVAAVMIPAAFPMIDSSADIPFLASFLQILRSVSIVLLLPMALAFIVKHYMHGLHHWIVSIKDLSFYTWALSLSIVSGVTLKSIFHSAAPVALIAVMAFLGLLMCIVQYSVGRFVGHYFGRVTESGQGFSKAMLLEPKSIAFERQKDSFWKVKA